MAKKNDLAAVMAYLSGKAEEFGVTLVDAELVREGKDRYLRVYIDKPGGITLDDCEAYHRAIADAMDEIDFDFLEVCSPGLDRPLKKRTDFELHRGEWIEVHLYRPNKANGQKLVIGRLLDAAGDGEAVSSFRIETDRETQEFTMKEVSLVRPYITFEDEPDEDRRKEEP